MSHPDDLLQAAEKILAVQARNHIEAVVIGTVALSAHYYVRQTEDLDLGINADVPTLRAVVGSLHEAGFEAELREPDVEDPLGGVIDVSGGFGLVQIVSFSAAFRR